MSQLSYWQPNTTYALGAYVFDGTGNIQEVTAPLGGGTSGAIAPVWTTGTTLDNGITWTFIGYGGRAIEYQVASPLAPGLVQISNDAVSYSRGGLDAGKFVLLDSGGQLDPSMGGGGGGGGSFSAITSGTNVSANMTVSGTAQLSYSGSGLINATEWAGTPITGSPTLGKIPIGQGTTAAWADPFVQGVYAPGANVLTAFGGNPIQPVLVGAQNPSNLLENLHVDASGNLFVNVSNSTLAVTQSGVWTVEQGSAPWSVTFPSAQAVTLASTTITGTVAVTQTTSPWVTSDSHFTHNLNQDGSGNVGVNVENSVAVTGTFWQATQPVSIASTITTNIQASGTALTATGSSLNVNITGGSSGNSAASATGSPVPADADYQGLNVGGTLRGWTGLSVGSQFAGTVAIVDASGNQITSFGGGTQYVDGVTQATPTGTVAMGKNPTNILHALSLDSSGNLNVNIAAGSSGNAAAGPTGSPVPADASYTGYNNAGNLVGVSTSNPLPVTVVGGGGSAVTLSPNTTFAFTRVLVNISTAGPTTVIAGVGGQTLRIYRFSLVFGAAVTVTLQDTAANTLFPATAVIANSTIQGEFDTQPKFPITIGNGFVINLGTTATVTGYMDYIQS